MVSNNENVSSTSTKLSSMIVTGTMWDGFSGVMSSCIITSVKSRPPRDEERVCVKRVCVRVCVGGRGGE